MSKSYLVVTWLAVMGSVLCVASLAGAGETKTVLRPMPNVKFNFSAFPNYQSDKSQRAKLMKDFSARYIDAYEADYVASYHLKDNPFPPVIKERAARYIDDMLLAPGPLKSFDPTALVKIAHGWMDTVAEKFEKENESAETLSKLESIDAHLERIEAALNMAPGTPSQARTQTLSTIPASFAWIGINRVTVLLGIVCVAMIGFLIRLFIR